MHIVLAHLGITGEAVLCILRKLSPAVGAEFHYSPPLVSLRPFASQPILSAVHKALRHALSASLFIAILALGQSTECEALDNATMFLK